MELTNYEEMVFTNYVNTIPNQREELIKELADITSSSSSSVYRWINGVTIPPIVKQKIIAKHLGISVDILFPPKKNETL